MDGPTLRNKLQSVDAALEAGDVNRLMTIYRSFAKPTAALILPPSNPGDVTPAVGTDGTGSGSGSGGGVGPAYNPRDVPPELYIACAEAAVRLNRLDISDMCLSQFESIDPPRTQWLCRASLVRARMISITAHNNRLKGQALVNALLTGIQRVMNGLDIALQQPTGSNYGFLIDNISAVYWEVVRPLLRDGWRRLLVPSMQRITDALEQLATDELDLLWHIQYHINLSLCCDDAGQFDAAARAIARAAVLSRTGTAAAAAVQSSSASNGKAGRLKSAASAAAGASTAIVPAATASTPVAGSGSSGSGAANSTKSGASGSGSGWQSPAIRMSVCTKILRLQVHMNRHNPKAVDSIAAELDAAIAKHNSARLNAATVTGAAAAQKESTTAGAGAGAAGADGFTGGIESIIGAKSILILQKIRSGIVTGSDAIEKSLLEALSHVEIKRDERKAPASSGGPGRSRPANSKLSADTAGGALSARKGSAGAARPPPATGGRLKSTTKTTAPAKSSESEEKTASVESELMEVIPDRVCSTCF